MEKNLKICLWSDKKIAKFKIKDVEKTNREESDD